MDFPYNPAVMFLDIYPREMKKIFLHKNLYTNIHNNFIHNTQKLKNTQMPFKGWMVKPWYLHTMEYHLAKKRMNYWCM